MTNHTLGPWYVSDDPSHLPIGGEYVILGEENHALGACEIAMLRHDENTNGPDEVRANARLIAAAPDMLDALELMVEWASGEHGEGPIGIQSLREAEAAIAKARRGERGLDKSNRVWYNKTGE